MIATAPLHTNGRPPEQARLRDLWRFVQRNRVWSFGIPLLMLAASALFVSQSAPVYEATSTIRIDEEQSNVAVLDVLKTLSSGSKIETEMEVLQSRTLAEDVVRSLDLNLLMRAPKRVPRDQIFASVSTLPTLQRSEFKFERQSGGRFKVTRRADGRDFGTYRPGDSIRLPGVVLVLANAALAHEEIVVRGERFQQAVRDMRRNISVSRPNRDADIVVVRYEGSDPVLVRQVPNTIAQVFIAQRRGVQNTQALSTVRFLSEQLDTLSGQLVTAENAVRGFRETERVVSPEAEAKAQVTRLIELQAQRDMIEAERTALAQMLEQVTTAGSRAGSSPASSLRRLIAFPTLLRNPAASELLRSLSEVENQRAELLNRRTLEDPDVIALSNRVQELEEQLATIAVTYLQGLSNQVASLNTSLGRFGGELDRIPATEVQFARLFRQAKVLEDIYTLLQTRLKEAQIAAAIEDPSVRVIDPAIAPLRPIKPNVPMTLALALMLGLVLGFGAAVAREHMDTTVHAREDLQLATGGIPILGMIPRIADARVTPGRFTWGSKPAAPAATNARLISMRDPRSPISEAYRSLRTNITFSNPERAPRTIVFTSPTPGDGKSTSAANLATTLAQQGTRCLLIDADLRRGLLHEVFDKKREPGLSNLLLGRATLEQSRHTIAIGDGVSVDFIPTGVLPPNPAELLGSPKMRRLLEQLQAEYEAIIIDAPPLNLVTDAALLGTNVDGVIIVARAGVTDRSALEYALSQLRAVRAPVLGTVLNDIDHKKDRYYGAYASGYYKYASQEN